MKQWLASVLLAAFGIVAAQTVNVLDPSQTYSTGNLVNNTTSPTNTTGLWQNVGSWNQGLPCWSPQDSMYGAYCGPAPYFNNGLFNFSYGVTDVHQYVNIANALPNSGTGLRVNGYNFGFQAKNGNGWDGAGLDTLSAYVTFYSKDGQTVKNDYYNLNYNFDWTTFNYSQTFNTPYATKDLSTVRYGFVGGDTSNYWAGPYGPEVYDVSFSLKYSVDPCYNNPLYSPTCPGYMDALNKLIPQSTTTTDPVASTSNTPTTTVTTTVIDDPINPTVTVTSTPTTNNVVQPAIQTVVSPTTTPSNTNRQSSPATSMGLSVVARNQQREQGIANQAVQTAVSNAAAAATSAQQESMSIAATAVANSTSSAISVTNQTSAGLGLRLSSVGIQVGGSAAQFGTDRAADAVMPAYNNMLTDRTNPLNEYIEHRPAMSGSTGTTGPVVNRNTANNEAAGGVDINKMALAPVGYNEYLNLTLRDAAFYAPKEVYKNQRNVDNVRALRQMSSDKLHQEMVQQQWR